MRKCIALCSLARHPLATTQEGSSARAGRRSKLRASCETCCALTVVLQRPTEDAGRSEAPDEAVKAISNEFQCVVL